MSGATEIDSSFISWLLAELDKRGWTREELSRRAGVGSSAITQVVNRQKNLGVDLAKAIAAGLGVPQRVVLIKAGLIDDEEAEGEIEAIRRMAWVLGQLDSDEDKDLALRAAEAAMRAVVDARKAKAKSKAALNLRASKT